MENYQIYVPQKWEVLWDLTRGQWGNRAQSYQNALIGYFDAGELPKNFIPLTRKFDDPRDRYVVVVSTIRLFLINDIKNNQIIIDNIDIPDLLK